MRIGLLSDTHVPLAAKALPGQVEEIFRNVDLILHAGDVYAVSVLDDLERIAPVLATDGDDDPFEIRSDKRVKWKHIFTVEGVTIWLTHQYERYSYAEPWVVAAHPDVVVFGHTHEAVLLNNNGILRINPGSPTFPRYKSELGTVGLLTINSGKAEAQVIQLL